MVRHYSICSLVDYLFGPTIIKINVTQFIIFQFSFNKISSGTDGNLAYIKYVLQISLSYLGMFFRLEKSDKLFFKVG